MKLTVLGCPSPTLGQELTVLACPRPCPWPTLGILLLVGGIVPWGVGEYMWVGLSLSDVELGWVLA